ncbi:MAG: multicopper oxidase domain-containing protein [Leucobacter sp.]|nr:multicopper oxidase domain-containing protein [Leucobacter sp.]
MRDLPTAAWLTLAVIASAAHRSLPAAPWLLLHLVFLGAITHAILVWSQHFALALTRSTLTVGGRRTQNTRLILANVGIALVLTGVPLGVWPLTVGGAALLIVAVIWHGISIIRRLRGALTGPFTRTVRYYIVSATCLPVGAALGAWIAGPGDPGGRLTLAHAIINALGWIGLTVAGTLVTLWPTMLRTRADDRASANAARALPVLAGGVLVAALGAAAGVGALVGLGLIAYAAGLGLLGVSFARSARRTPPRSFATLSAGAGVLWWAACLVVIVVRSAPAWPIGSELTPIVQAIDWAAPFLAAGFAAQVLLGALSYLVPVVVGGGPTPVRVGTTAFDRLGGLRVSTANVALFVCALPVPSLVRVASSVLYLVAMAAFIPLLLIALRRQSQAKRAGLRLEAPAPDAAGDASARRRGPMAPEGEQPRGRRAGQAVAGLLAIILVAAIGGALDPHALGSAGAFTPGPSTNSTAPDSANAPVRTVQVTAANMRFTPSRIEVPVGTRLVIELTNTDPELVHDLVLANGVQGSRLAPGASETIDVGVVSGDVAGWCSIAGHRQMGMTLDIIATDAPGADDTGDAAGGMEGMDHGTHSGGEGGESAAALIDLSKSPSDGFEPYGAVLDPLPKADGPVTHRITLPVTEQVQEVAPGVTQRLWTFGGTAPGPVFHGRVGDTFVVTLVNDGTIGHSIDFHAGALAPDQPMRTIAPGESLTYTFTATRSGIWMYHCSTMPMSAHIANGMYGAVIIEPDDLPEVDRSYALVQGEYYLGPQGGEVDMDRVMTGDPDLVTFNGYAAQYDHAPLPARVGERVRVWVLDAGPNRATSFHVVGGQFDTVWSEGRYLINRARDTGSQSLGLQPAQGGFVELVFPEAGHYPFVSHVMIDAERGAHGIFEVAD